MQKNPIFPEWLRMTVLGVAGIILALSVFSLYAAAANWTGLPANPLVILYFLIVLIVVPLLAAYAFVLAWQGRSPRLAAVLTAIPAIILLLRAVLFGGA